MPKLTLLEMTQDILNDMDSDEVNSISETVEAEQVANIIKTTYYELLGFRLWPHTEELISLEPSADVNKPTHMRMPTNLIKMGDVRYDKRLEATDPLLYQAVYRLDPEEFLDTLYGRNSTDTTVDTIDESATVKLLIYNDRAPLYWTSFDDENIVFDSYDNTLDTTLQSSKVVCHALIDPTFSLTDDFTPDMPVKAFPYLLSEAKSVCFNALKQQPNVKEEQRSRRQRHWLSREKFREGGGIRYPNYGRKK